MPRGMLPGRTAHAPPRFENSFEPHDGVSGGREVSIAGPAGGSSFDVVTTRTTRARNMRELSTSIPNTGYGRPRDLCSRLTALPTGSGSADAFAAAKVVD